MANSPRILTVRVIPGESSTEVRLEHGLVELVKEIPAGKGIVRFSVVFDSDNRLADVELVTAQVS